MRVAFEACYKSAGMPDLEKLHQAVIEGDWKTAAAVTHAAIAEGVAALTIVGCLVSAMDEVGRLFECEEYFVPEMLLSARAMKASDRKSVV